MTDSLTTRSKSPWLLITATAAFSGFAGLGYEMVWTRLLANSFGHEITAVLGVLAALFGGIALGSFAFGSPIARSAKPAIWYAVLELAIGCWALVLIPLFPALSGLLPVLNPVDSSPFRQWAVAFFVPSLVLLPATMAMGATVPALEAMLRPFSRAGRAVGIVYGANTFGAVAGTVATTFVLMPALGLSRTLMACAAINGLCAVVSLLYARQAAPSAPAMALPRPQAAQPLLPLFVTGLLGIGYEVVAVRTLSLLLQNTIYTFAALLAVYLLGTSLGASLYARWMHRRTEAAFQTWLPAAVSLLCIIGTLALSIAGDAELWFRQIFPRSVPGAIQVEFAMAVLVFLLPTIGMGALFTALAQRAREARGSLGPALAANTAGAALAPILFGPLLLPLLGAKLALLAIAAAYACIALEWRWSALLPRAAAMSIGALLTLTPLSLRYVAVPPGGKVLWYRDGTMAAVSVVENRAGDNYLAINNLFRLGGTASMRSDYREADLPLLLHPGPSKALFLGLGTGSTISAAADHPGLDVDGVELVPEVIESFGYFSKSANLQRPNLHFHIADARRFVQATPDHYDVVVADVYHPWIDGTASLYTREHFAAIRGRLKEGGIFCQWLPLHQLDLPTLKTIIRTFQTEFPDSSAYVAQFNVEAPLIALVGYSGPHVYSADWFEQRIHDASLKSRLAAVELAKETALFGLFLADKEQLAGFAGPGAINTDDSPVVSFDAPRIAYGQQDTPGHRLVAVIHSLHPRAEALLGADGDPQFASRLSDYWRARDRFIEMGADLPKDLNPATFVFVVAPKLVDVVAISPDFDPAYGPAVAMTRTIAQTDPVQARHLLELLDRENPSRPEARQLLAAFAAQ